MRMEVANSWKEQVTPETQLTWSGRNPGTHLVRRKKLNKAVNT